MNVHHDLHVCAECLCELANGESSLTDAEREVHYASVEHYARMGLHVVPGDEDFGFCHSRCDLCDGLAGERYAAHTLGR